MVRLSFKIGCRNCMQGDGIEHIYTVSDGEQNVYESKSEFEVMLKIEQWRIEDAKTCDLCGASSVEILEIKAGDFSLYNYDRLIKKIIAEGKYSLMINIDKRDSQINLRPGGSVKIEPNFFKSALFEIINTIKDRPDDNFIPHMKGNFFMCITGGFDFVKNINFTRVERFRNAGITKVELLNAIKAFAQQYGLDF